MCKPTVAVGNCGLSLEDDEVEEEFSKQMDLIGGLPDKIKDARRILVKPNLGFPDVRKHRGRLIALTEPCVTRSVLRRIREDNDKAEIVISDGPLKGLQKLAEQLGYDRIAEEFEAELVDCNSPPYVEVEVPGKPLIMRRYTLNETICKAEATVSIAKMKVHLFAGVSLCMKNLFGFPPESGYGGKGYGRTYLHYPFRLPRCIVDLTSIFKPCLNIIEGLVGEEQQEWSGPPVESNLLIVGDNPVATDAIGTVTMGFNPEAEFPMTPFLYDINHLKLAEKLGLGPCDPSKIRVVGEDPEEVQVEFRKLFASNLPPETHLETRRYLAQQATHYLEVLPELVENHRGKYALIGDGKVQKIYANLDEFNRVFWRSNVTYRSDTTKQETPKIPFVKKIEPEKEDPEVIEAFTDPQ